MQQIIFKKKDLDILLDPEKNQSSHVEKSASFFAGKYFCDCDWPMEVILAAFDNLGSNKVDVLTGYEVKACYFPPVLDFIFLLMDKRYHQNYDSEKFSEHKFSEICANSLAKYDSERVYLIDHRQDYDECPNPPALSSAQIKTTNLLFDPLQMKSSIPQLFHTAVHMYYNWSTTLIFRTDPKITNPFTGLEMDLNYQQNHFSLFWKKTESF